MDRGQDRRQDRGRGRSTRPPHDAGGSRSGTRGPPRGGPGGPPRGPPGGGSGGPPRGYRSDDRSGHRGEDRGGYRGEDRGYRGDDRGPSREPPRDWGPQRGGPTRGPVAGPSHGDAGASSQLPMGRGLVRGETLAQPVPMEVQVGGQGDGGGVGGNRVRGRVRAGYAEERVVTRPQHVNSKLGVTGRPVQLLSNYFEVVKKPNWTLLQYRVDFDPEEDRTPLKKFLFRRAINTTLRMFMFDGTVMYAVERLDPLPMELFVEDERNENKKYRVTIKLVGDVTPADGSFIQFFNIILRKCLGHLRLQLIGRNFFDEGAKIMLNEHRLQIWPGYVTSIRQHEKQLLLCTEISHKVLRTDTVYNFLETCLQEDRNRYKENFAMKIMGNIVLTQYNNKTYHVDQVDWESTPSSTFNMKDGSAVSYVDYYKRKYNINIRHPSQPMLVSRAKAREIRAGMSEVIYLVPELCHMTGLSEAQRANFQLMRAFSDQTRVGPTERIQKLLAFSRRLASQPEVMTELRQWDFGLADKIVNFSGRILPPEELRAGNNRAYSANANVDWSRDVRQTPFVHGAQFNSFVILCTNRAYQGAEAFGGMLMRVAKGMGWNIPQPRMMEVRSEHSIAYVEAIDAAVQQYRPSLIMCVVPNNNSDRYAIIKKKSYVDLAIPTQIIVMRNLMSKGAMSIATKVAIQMNCKLGGIPWTIPMPAKGLMVVGFDVCHDATNKNKSYGALVATLGSSCTSYYSTCTQHTNGEELSNNFSINILKAVQAFQEKEGAFPKKIMILRDGVGDGQIGYVNEHEVSAVRQSLEKNIYTNGDLQMAFIIVSKRINTRIFNANRQNPDPGTVVDDVITLPERYDYFIVSQSTRQGTVAPTSYNVIYDTMGCSPDQLQRLTYKLCHLYYNWSGGIRVPAPCQYAHKLAFLVGQSLHRNPHANLSRLLYFL